MGEFDNQSVMLYEGDDVSGKAGAAIVGKRFVDISADRDDPLGTAVGSTNDVVVQHAAAGAKPFGVSKYDQPTVGKVVGCHCKAKRIVPVTASGAITASDEVGVGAAGKAVALAGSGVAATLATGVVGTNNAITWTANDVGDEGNGLSITIVDPAGNNAALAVDVDGDDIVVSLATDGASAPTSTATEVIAAVAEHDTASRLVTADDTGASTGAGVVAAVAETSLAGGVDTAAAAGKAVADAADNTDCFVQLY